MAMSRRKLLAASIQVTSAAAAATTLGDRGTAAAETGPGTAVRGTPAGLWAGVHRHPVHPSADPVRRPGRIPRRGANFPRHPVRASVLHYGALPDGSADAAPAINRAIAAVGERGGGTVLHAAGHVPDRRRDPDRLEQHRAARRGQRSHHAVRDQEPHRADRRLRQPLRRRQVVLVLGGRPHLALPAGPLGHPHRRDPGEGLALRGLDRQQARRVADADHRHRRAARADRHRRRRLGAAARRTRTAPARRRRRGTLLEHMSGGGPGPEAYHWDDKTKLTSYVPYEWPVRVTSAATGSPSSARSPSTPGCVWIRG